MRKKIWLGKRVTSPYPFGLYSDDIWTMQIVGQPGFGKSTFEGNLAEAFADAGEGVLLIDVKGDLARNVAARTKHYDRLIYIDPIAASNAGHYWSLNPLDFDRSDTPLFNFYADVLPELLPGSVRFRLKSCSGSTRCSPRRCAWRWPSPAPPSPTFI